MYKLNKLNKIIIITLRKQKELYKNKMKNI